MTDEIADNGPRNEAGDKTDADRARRAANPSSVMNSRRFIAQCLPFFR